MFSARLSASIVHSDPLNAAWGSFWGGRSLEFWVVGAAVILVNPTCADSAGHLGDSGPALVVQHDTQITKAGDLGIFGCLGECIVGVRREYLEELDSVAGSGRAIFKSIHN
jgi:hypothetical protein